jgi:hypothetical protein
MKKAYYLFFIAIFGAILWSCSSDESESPNNQICKEYLDLDVNNIKSFTYEDKQILDAAKSRMDQVVTINDNKYVLTVSSGKEINMSERLFQSFIRAITITNQKIATGELFLYNNKLYGNDTTSINVSRIKTRSEGGDNSYSRKVDHYYGGSVTTTTFNGKGSLEYYNNYSNNNTIVSNIAGLLSVGLGLINPYVGGAVEVSHRVLDMSQSSTGKAILEAAKKGPIQVVTYCNYMCPSTSPGYNSTYVYDCN